MRSCWSLLFVTVMMVVIPSCMSDSSDGGGSSGGGCSTSGELGSGGDDDCWFGCGDGGGGGGGGSGGGGGGGGDDDCWFDCVFSFDDVPAIGAGTVIEVDHEGPDEHHFTVESSDPSVAEVRVDPAGIHVTGRAAGVVKLTARGVATDQVLDEVEVEVVDVAAIELHFRPAPGLDQPVSALAALAGSTDAFGIVYRSADGAALGGRGIFEVTGAPLLIVGAPETYRMSDIVVRRQQVQLEFGAPGTGTLVARLHGVALRAEFPIEVVPAPASLEVVMMVLRGGQLVAAPDPVATSDFIGSQIVGRTADGRFVGGVTAVWSSPDPVSFLTPPAPTTESVFLLGVAGGYDLVTTVGTTSITTTMSSQ